MHVWYHIVYLDLMHSGNQELMELLVSQEKVDYCVDDEGLPAYLWMPTGL